MNYVYFVRNSINIISSVVSPNEARADIWFSRFVYDHIIVCCHMKYFFFKPECSGLHYLLLHGKKSPVRSLKCLLCGRRKKESQVWNDTRVSKWWQNFNLWISFSFRLKENDLHLTFAWLVVVGVKRLSLFQLHCKCPHRSLMQCFW